MKHIPRNSVDRLDREPAAPATDNFGNRNEATSIARTSDLCAVECCAHPRRLQMSRLRPSQWPPACSFGSLVPDEEAQVPGNVEAIHPREGRGCGLGCTGQYSCARGDKSSEFRQFDALGVSHHYHLLLRPAGVYSQRPVPSVICEGGCQDPPRRRNQRSTSCSM